MVKIQNSTSLSFNISRKQTTPHPALPVGVPLELATRSRRGHPRTAHYTQMSSKGRIELQLSQSRAKFDQEVAGDVRFCIAPQKTGEHVKKNKKISEKFSRKNFFGVEKRNVGNRLKRVFPKFGGPAGQVRGENFAKISAKVRESLVWSKNSH